MTIIRRYQAATTLQLIPVLVLWGMAALAYLLYRQAFPGGFLYDDATSLQGLADVTDFSSALIYAMTGEAGPLGRPISLAAFLVNATSWPTTPADFHYTNTLLHLINGLLVAWLAALLARPLLDIRHNQAWFATAVAGIWLLHPAWTFLVLHAVQRMAILATTFILLGLIAYLKSRDLMATRPWPAMALMSGSLAIGTLLAAFAKESGLLLPLYAATLEWLLRSRESRGLALASPMLGRLWKYWGPALFWIPALLLAVALYQHWPGFGTGSPLREFTGGQRLLTEARVLWQYLFNLFFPRPSHFSPFHDDYPISQDVLTPISTLFALLAWLVVLAAAWRWRQRFPVLFFAVAWFLVGHSMESSVVQLEVYFEHRNYLPGLGPVILLAYALWRVPQDLSRLRWFVLGAYSLLLGFVLWQLTTMWGQPAIAAQMLADRHPLSVRTLQFYANQLGTSGQVIEATSLVWQAHLNLPNDAGLAVQSAQLLCPFSRPDDFENLVKGILPTLRQGSFSHLVTTSLPVMFKQLAENTCPAHRADHLHDIIDALLSNPKFQASARTTATLHYLKGRLYMREGNFNSTLEHMLESSRLDPNLDLTLEIARIFASGGLHAEALKILDDALEHGPGNPLLREPWRKRIEPLRGQLLREQASGHPSN